MPVYLIRAGENGPVKIGVSDDPWLRLSQLQISHYETLRIIRLLDGSEVEEASLHHRFCDLWLRGEWHSFSREMMGDLGLDDLSVCRERNPEPEPAPSAPPIGSQFAERLIIARKAAGLGRAALGRKMGLSHAAITQWETNATVPRLHRIQDLATVLGVTPDWLLSPAASDKATVEVAA